ncbi:NAD(P)H-quinone oxidoreductase subunit H, chloroplastic [Linum perenne]
MIVNMGPHHPSMHGVLRLIVTLDGEDVIDCEPILGYLHRGMEKIGENRTIIQYLPYVTRWDYLATMFTEAITVNGPEQLGNIQVPKRASYIRVILLELSRIASHLLWLGPFMADIVDHYESYDEFDWEVPWQKEGDSLARYLVRIGEMTESITIIQQALERIPGGPYENLETRHFDRERHPEWDDFEYRFIKELYVRVEAPKGELGIFSHRGSELFSLAMENPSAGFYQFANSSSIN